MTTAATGKKPPVQGHLHVIVLAMAPQKKSAKQGSKRSTKS